MTKTVTLLTGPQGAGNHVFSKIFALANVTGWTDLNILEYQGHDKEPFFDIWDDANNVDKHCVHDDIVVSISCPYINKGIAKIPNYAAVISRFIKNGYKVQVAIIGRDATILSNQQQRVRGNETTNLFLEQLVYLTAYKHIFLSQELLYLYKGQYITSVARELGFYIDVNSDEFNDILLIDANEKYINQVNITGLDNAVWKASQPIYSSNT